MTDPRDAAKMNNDGSGNTLPQKIGTDIKFKNKFGVPPPIEKQDGPTWTFSKEEKDEWTSSGNDFNIETPIGHAWARLLARGISIGPPTSDVNKISTIEDVDVYRQLFQHATGLYVDDSSSNPNLVVEFSDARGIVGTESGI